MGAGLFTVLEARRKVVDFSRIFGREEVTILMRTPERASKADSLLAPFNKEVNTRKLKKTEKEEISLVKK